MRRLAMLIAPQHEGNSEHNSTIVPPVCADRTGPITFFCEAFRAESETTKPQYPSAAQALSYQGLVV